MYRAASDDRLDILGIRTRMNPIHVRRQSWRPTETEHVRLELDTAIIIQIVNIDTKSFHIMNDFGDGRPLRGYECR